MAEAIKEAKKALAIDEVPIGGVMVRNGEIIARGYNKRNILKSALAHAEIELIQKASAIAGDWRLEDCAMYVTLEPCPMCAGAIVQARIPLVVYGAPSAKAGCCGTVLNLLDQQGLNHRAEVRSGVLVDQCSELISGFFREFRVRQFDAGEGNG